MAHTTINPATVSAPIGNYAHGLVVAPNARWLYISGQIPEALNGTVPFTFEAQCHQAWQNVLAVLQAAEMSVPDLVKVTTYLTHSDQVDANGAIRREYLGDYRPALTVVIVQTLNSAWLLEIEAVAARVP